MSTDAKKRERFENDVLEAVTAIREGREVDADELRAAGVPSLWHRRLRTGAKAAKSDEEAIALVVTISDGVHADVEAGKVAPPGKERAAAALSSRAKSSREAVDRFFMKGIENTVNREDAVAERAARLDARLKGEAE